MVPIADSKSSQALVNAICGIFQFVEKSHIVIGILLYLYHRFLNFIWFPCISVISYGFKNFITMWPLKVSLKYIDLVCIIYSFSFMLMRRKHINASPCSISRHSGILGMYWWCSLQWYSNCLNCILWFLKKNGSAL